MYLPKGGIASRLDARRCDISIISKSPKCEMAGRYEGWWVIGRRLEGSYCVLRVIDEPAKRETRRLSGGQQNDGEILLPRREAGKW